MAVSETAQRLVNVVQRLLRQHRDGIVPGFGEIENLADLANQLQQALSRRQHEARSRGRAR